MTAVTKDASAASGAAGQRRGPRNVVGIMILLGAAFCGWSVYVTEFAGINPGPSLIEELRKGEITGNDIKSIEFLEFTPSTGWPFSEEEYERLPRRSIDSPATRNGLLSLLRDQSSDGWQHRNHPATYYYGILRVELVEGGHYYVFYDLEQERGPYYVSLRANSKGSTNPNGATWYENEPLADFLKQNDPWYRDADTAETSDRPDSNDNSPPPDLCHGS